MWSEKKMWNLIHRSIKKAVGWAIVAGGAASEGIEESLAEARNMKLYALFRALEIGPMYANLI